MKDIVRCGIMHYTVGGPAERTAAWFGKRTAKASAHFIFDRDGTIIQCVSLDRKAWHAGKSKSIYGPSVNDHSIGFEISNFGPLHLGIDGGLYNVYDHPFEGQYILIEGEPWEKYTEAQLESLEAVLALLSKHERYQKAAEVLFGHDEICIPRGRKIDPGPHFPWSRFL